MNKITWQIDCKQNDFRPNDCKQNAQGEETWQINCTGNDSRKNDCKQNDRRLFDWRQDNCRQIDS